MVLEITEAIGTGDRGIKETGWNFVCMRFPFPAAKWHPYQALSDHTKYENQESRCEVKDVP